MLYFVLPISILHLAWMNWLAYRKADFAGWFLSGVLLLPLNFCAPSIPLALQSIVLPFLVFLCFHVTRNRPAIFLAASSVAVIAIFSIVAWDAKTSQDRLFAQYPMESMVDRAPQSKVSMPHVRIEENHAWQQLNDHVTLERESFATQWRNNRLKLLHDDTTTNFVNSPGFGITRMTAGRMGTRAFEHGVEPVEPIPQSPEPPPAPLSTEDLERPYDGSALTGLSSMHFDGLRDFIHVAGFGYIKDRSHVAGFKPHQFSKKPDAGLYAVSRLELVSLSMHEKPVVYVSKNLPRMNELQGAPTRGLSDFEAMGLMELARGEDLFVRAMPPGLLMLGAIRSVQQCVQCHGGETGDLLGAFSYSLK